MSSVTSTSNFRSAFGSNAVPERALDWRHKAACTDQSPELFFPIGESSPAWTQLQQAKQVCGRGVVKEACLHWALELRIEHGVWGGLSESERKALRRRATRARTGAASTAE
jgi:WhiB family redox-sensing transcriptional regulator